MSCTHDVVVVPILDRRLLGRGEGNTNALQLSFSIQKYANFCCAHLHKIVYVPAFDVTSISNQSAIGMTREVK